MEILNAGFILLSTVVGMEAFSWFIHKYLFHGPLWFIHKTHHGHTSKYFMEWNDLFSLVFAALSIYLMWIGKKEFNGWFWFGAGITLYGLIYFIFHDWFIHKRFKSFKTSNGYLKAIRKAHKIHHKSMDKRPSEEFGLLIVSRKYFRSKHRVS